MSLHSRHAILSRLKSTPPSSVGKTPDYAVIEARQWTKDKRIDRLREHMEAVHTQVLECTSRGFGQVLRRIIREKNIERLLVGAGSEMESKLQALKQRTPEKLPELVPYAEPIEQGKDLLFEIDASITSVRSAIADTGSLILWPTPQEPRLMSLIPPIHLAVLKVSTIHNTLLEALRQEAWHEGMPSNALLVSGPSKTADIEQTLVYGIHGPKQLAVFMLNDC
jgi:L-lactate dehydrogenase complex protein LldG